MSRIIAVLTLMLGLNIGAFAQYNINFDLQNYESDTLVVGYYFGSQTLAMDTLVSTDHSKFQFKGDTTLNEGVYMALKRPDNAYIQFFVPEDDQEFNVQWDVNTDLPAFEGSRDNQIFADYASFLTKKRGQLDKLQNLAATGGVSAQDTSAMMAEINKLDQEVIDYQKNVVKHNPGTLSAMVLAAGIEPEIPNYTPADGNVEQLRYEFYKKHYFDNIDLGNPTTLRTPFINEKIMYYLDKLVSYDPNQINSEIDFLLREMESAPRTRRFYLGEFLDKYANARVIGLDAVFVHLADTYYSEAKTPWVPAESLAEIRRLAGNMKKSLIGNTFPEITTFDKDGTPLNINGVTSPYKVVVFWAHTCSHCKESMPELIKFNNNFKNQGVKVITVCTKGRKKAAECMKYVADRADMEDMINTFDAKRGWAKSVYVPTTPGVFILDSNNKILLKDIPVSKLNDIMPRVMKMYPSK